MMNRERRWVSRKRMAMVIGFMVLMLGAVSAVVFAGLSDDRDYPTAWGMTTAEHLNLPPDLGDRNYTPNQAPTHTTLLAPQDDAGSSNDVTANVEEQGGMFSSVARANNQFNRISKARKANAPKSCHPFDRGCLQKLACQGVTTSSSVSRAPCIAGDIICSLRMACA